MRLVRKRDVLDCLTYSGSGDMGGLITLFKDRIKAIPTLDTDEFKNELKPFIEGLSNEQKQVYRYIMEVFDEYVSMLEERS